MTKLSHYIGDNGLYGCGTVCKHRIGFPPTLKTIKLTNRYNTINLKFVSNDITVMFTSKSNSLYLKVESSTLQYYNIDLPIVLTTNYIDKCSIHFLPY